ncbi:hypothetical protein LguiA_030887 [Lonicera macranthoides]
MMASTLFIAGAAISAGAEYIWMLILGRVFFGIGVGFGNEMESILRCNSTLVSIYTVDRAGRKKLLLQGCIEMFIAQMAIGGILVVYLKDTGSLNKTLAIVVVLMVCVFVMAFAWSWGPLGWLIPTEIFPLETRTAGFAFAVSTNMLDFVHGIVQCSCYRLPETKGVPMDDMVERVQFGRDFIPNPGRRDHLRWHEKNYVV